MRVLLAHKFFETRGGAEVFFFETGRVLEENGHQAAYFASSLDLSQADGQRVFLVPPPDYQTANPLKRMSQAGRMIYSRDVKAKFAEAIRVFRPEIVHAYSIHVHLTPSILSAANEAGIPVVMSCNDYKHICPNYKLYHHGRICTDCRGRRFYKAVTNVCCKGSLSFSVASAIEAYTHDRMRVYDKVHTYLFSSDFMARETERFWGADTFRWRRLRNPFDSTRFPLEPAYEDYALFFGRLIEEKGVDVLLEAARLAPFVRLKIVGNGPDEVSLKARASKLGLSNVEFLGPLWGPRLNAVLSRTRFVVVPSVWHENYPYVINQSFAFGKAVIAANRGGMPELVTHGETGLIYEATDPSALADSLASLWRDPERAVALGRAAKARADAEFNDKRFLQSLLGIYREVLDAGAGDRR